MLILRAFLLWMLISVHVVGAAALFRRLFPRESVWLGFVIPEIVLVLFCNFIEYHMTLGSLRIFLPLTTVAFVFLILGPNNSWRVIRLPTLIFLGSFAFTLFLRMLRPDIEDIRDGISDMGLISDFLFGQTLPVESSWDPPIRMLWYYCLPHYGASVLIRLLGIDLGTGFNLAGALLAAYISFLTGAVAWHLSRGKLWIVLLMLALTFCAAPGETGYLWLTIKDLDPEGIINPYLLFDLSNVQGNWLKNHLTPIDLYNRHELIPPSFWSWMGCYHSAEAGQFVIGFSILSLIELVRPRKTNWPWIAFILAPVLMLTMCGWGVPLAGIIFVLGAFACWKVKTQPKNWVVVLAFTAGMVACLEPMLSYLLNWHLRHVERVAGQFHTEFYEFLTMWWPVYLPWVALFVIWKRIHPATCVILITAPLAFAGVETWNLGQRYDMTGKLWGMTYLAAWITFVPTIALERKWPFRGILLLIVISSALSLGYWVTYTGRVVRVHDIDRLDGRGSFREDERKARILETLTHLDRQTIIPGKSNWAGASNALFCELSTNRAYVTWSLWADTALYTNGIDEAERREMEVNDLYVGKNDHPLFFPRQRNIAALVIDPDDDIDPALVLRFKQELAPYYTFSEANYIRDPGDPPPTRTAGVFIYHPEIKALLGTAPGEHRSPFQRQDKLMIGKESPRQNLRALKNFW